MDKKTSLIKMNQRNHPLRIGIIGMGGFAGAHHSAIYELEKRNLAKLVCTCDIHPENFKKQIQELNMEKRGVKIFNNYLNMLDEFKDILQMVTIPAPIHLHAEMHRECVNRKLPVYLEKPPTLDYFELLQMIETEKKAIKNTNVGFNYIVQDLRQDLKRRIIQGEFGEIKKITFTGLWPRYPSYFKRSQWAGRLIIDNKIVLDSCFGNALSHYIHNILFWCGKKNLFSWDPVKIVHAELYRAHQIQSTDTVFVSASTENVSDIRIILTHACAKKTPDIEKIYCSDAEIVFEGNKSNNGKTFAESTIEWKDGKIERKQQENQNLVISNIQRYIDYLSGKENRPLTKIDDCIPFVMFNDLIYIAAEDIACIPEQYLEHIDAGEGEKFITIKNIESIAEEFIERKKFPSEQKIPWAHKGGVAKNTDITRLNTVIQSLVEKTQN